MITITHDGIEIVLRKPTVRDDLNAQIMRKRLEDPQPDGASGYWAVFAQICSQTVSAKGLPFEPSSLVGTNGNTLETAYEQFLDLPKGLKDKAVQALNDLEKPIDEALSKDAGKSADPK